MYFPPNYTSISMDLKLDFGNYSGSILPVLLVEFFNANGQKIKFSTKTIPLNTTSFSTFNLGFPSELYGKTGTFRISVNNEVVLTSGNPQLFKMYIKNVELTNYTQTVAAPTIIVDKTSVLGGQTINFTATGCETGIVHWTTGQTGQSVNHSPIETKGYTAYCEMDGFYSTPSNAVVVTVNYNQNLASSEYFFDTDPGYGAGTALPLSGSPAVIDQTFNIGLAAHNLTQGVHTFGVRLKDNNNKWSLTHTRTFLLLGIASGNGLNNIVGAEYFIDSLKQDKSNLVITNVTSDGDLIALDLPNTFSQGVHTVSYRVKDSEGKYSLFHTRTFLVLGTALANGVNRIEKLEYFVDELAANNANLVNINVTPSGDLMVVDLPITMTQGVHTVSYRVKDRQGKSSLFHTRTFLVIGAGTGNGAITQVEYFMDNDPGFGLGTLIPYTASNTTAMPLNLNLTSLSQGVHVLYVRVKTNQGKWSLTHARAFVIMPSTGSGSTISKIEYFIDNVDPGQGNGINASFVANPNNSDVIAVFDLNVSQLSVGIHKINVRTKDSNNSWSNISFSNFEIIILPCPQTQTISESLSTGQKLYQSAQTTLIQNTNYTGNLKAEIKAGNSVTLGPGTKFDGGSIVKIYIGGCP
jgi:hypothetical protein